MSLWDPSHRSISLLLLTLRAVSTFSLSRETVQSRLKRTAGRVWVINGGCLRIYGGLREAARSGDESFLRSVVHPPPATLRFPWSQATSQFARFLSSPKKITHLILVISCFCWVWPSKGFRSKEDGKTQHISSWFRFYSWVRSLSCCLISAGSSLLAEMLV